MHLKMCLFFINAISVTLDCSKKKLVNKTIFSFYAKMCSFKNLCKTLTEIRDSLVRMMNIGKYFFPQKLL